MIKVTRRKINKKMNLRKKKNRLIKMSQNKFKIPKNLKIKVIKKHLKKRNLRILIKKIQTVMMERKKKLLKYRIKNLMKMKMS